jgi:hypothetical protein
LHHITWICIFSVSANPLFMWNEGEKHSCWKSVSVVSYHGNAGLRLQHWGIINSLRLWCSLKRLFSRLCRINKLLLLHAINLIVVNVCLASSVCFSFDILQRATEHYSHGVREMCIVWASYYHNEWI